MVIWPPRKTREPVGIVGVITPCNVPSLIPAWKIAPALAYGNCVVIKPAELTPASAFELVKIPVECGLPKGVLNLVMGRGSVVGDALLRSPDIDAISFTGSVETGKHIAVTAVEHHKKVQCEMGGKNPLNLGRRRSRASDRRSDRRWLLLGWPALYCV